MKEEKIMPFINSKVSVPMTGAQKESVKQKLGKAISIIPGKSERWLMLEFADNCDLYFSGDNSKPTAMIEVEVFGSIPDSCLDEMTRSVCDIYEEELRIPKDRIYVKYEGCDKWGWNGGNF